ncbi:nucleoid-associated protein Lsr2 [Cellulomonas hominis]|uniref:Nucleoid-associated protein Lsr2 n=1 Tax=Cellulomonas hominis TaxID=156981 RepID=A0A511FJC2_9CELL|nr:Lsr2 family protein [Cellulomonas hominis]MBB5474822.1 hypothetical protein [Cellulomonas hominis]NKY05662.1 Lsr2 family protein [Cellulomonas hominis]GEL48477.1 nucleoid-associated protein Lsr2 [Cellulomonas hominis]
MARKTQITLIDDFDGAPADETVTFALDGVHYEIDLTTARAAELRDAVAKYVAHGRKIGSQTRARSTSSRGSREATRDYNPAEVRTWATAQGIEIPARGRIPAGILEQYRSAH